MMKSTRQKVYTPRIRPLGLVGLTPVVVLAAFGLNAAILGNSKPLYSVIFIVGVTLSWIVWIMWPYQRLHRALRTHGRFICLRCLYPLRGLPDSGICPECAEPYQRAELARLWRLWEISSNKGKPVAKDE